MRYVGRLHPDAAVSISFDRYGHTNPTWLALQAARHTNHHDISNRVIHDIISRKTL